MTELAHVSDQQREAAVARLSATVEAGQLSLDDFGDRVAAVYQARTVAELESLCDRLPDAGRVPPDDPAAAQQTTLLGTVKRSGRWRLPAYTAILVAVGSVKLDLREAELAGPEAAVAVAARVGTVKVWVPASWRVEVYGGSAIGGRYVEENQLPPDVPAPTLRLRLDTSIGTVKVYRV